MTGIPAHQVPLSSSTEEHNEYYKECKDEENVFLVVDDKEPGYSVSYDLLPTGHRLTDEAQEDLDERVKNEIKAILNERDFDTNEARVNVGDSKGNIYFLENEQTARDIAAVISQIIHNEENWEKEPSPEEFFSG